ncbi:lipid-A-disaccharide synthase [Falsirhodobacter halotolerans]|uniref:lipid-A-disaccharide synthase n=1 Tax=Falsirhodobacter halotolerans TaxID=1146892 RepID=UPI001FD4A287|nr:lipid-A-disaccharide synthase [Falsirhodobacter halotolerans]MCJ8139640.1 lipid-A-disaccharide synthase [Falsirhodobacter halotolerans]
MKLFLIAGEPSGDRLGAALMRALKGLRPDVSFFGVGGPAMTAEGLTSLFPMDELSVMGIAEVLPKYMALKRRIRECADAVIAMEPQALITIDSPDFNLRVARLVKEARPKQRTIHYVAPSVWAWRPKRAEKMARSIDHVLALLPFEPPYMTAVGMTCDFVGHPVVSEAKASDNEAWAFRQNVENAPLILALPGSRRGEVSRLTPILGEVMARVRERFPQAGVLLPTVPGVADLVRDLTAGWPIAPQIIQDPAGKRIAFRAADVAIAASGTVSLELAANRLPMVVAYDMNPLSMWMMRKMALIDTVTLVNLVSDTRAVPEFLGRECRADRIAPAVLDLLDNEVRAEAQRRAMEITMTRLGEGGDPPAERAARSVLQALT